jgi:prolyl oligopeptidase PreP (S9A serine peptidase family)
MKFSDNIKRTSLEDVFVIRTTEEMEAREEYNSNLWDLERENFLKKGNNIYKTVVRDVKIGERIYNKNGKLFAYRVD